MPHNQHLSLVLLKPYFRLALLLLTGFAAVGMGAAALGRNAPSHLNPFEAYLDIFPGQPMSAVEARGFSCLTIVNNYYALPSEIDCRLNADNGMFSAIYVGVAHLRVQHIRFILRDKTLRLGDLLVMFGLPQYQSYGQLTFGFCGDYFVSADTSRSAMVIPVSQPIWNVSFATLIR